MQDAYQSIIVIDENKAIAEQFNSIFEAKNERYVEAKENSHFPQFKIDYARSCLEGLGYIKKALSSAKPYALAFMDVCIPPRWSRVETAREILMIDPDIQVVLFATYLDFTPEEIARDLKEKNRWLILKKPFDVIEVYQMVHVLTEKWKLNIENKNDLPNRILLTDRIQQAIAHAKHSGLYVAILLLDFDNFKDINYSLGYHMGDLLLRSLAKKIISCVRETDTVTRFGGDKFAIVLASREKEEDIYSQARKLLEFFSSSFQIENHTIMLTASIGISIYSKDGNDFETLLKNADSALYYAKEIGRNCFQHYLPEHGKRNLERVELAAALKQALNNKELMLHYQPLVQLRTNQVVGVEALLRWQHSKLGLLLSETFVHLAEETGLILPVGEWVMRTACLQNKAWQQLGLPKIRMAVNVSALQLRQENFVDLVRQILEETQHDPDLLELEITENLILSDVSKMIIKMEKLKELGVHLAIDDFGIGYSSLSYLRYFPFDRVKIDKSFIEEITSNNSNGSIVKAIITMTKKLGMTVLAEGIEKHEQIEFLREHCCDEVQGFYISLPLEEKSCTHFLRKQFSQR